MCIRDSTGSISGITARVIGVTDATTTDAPTLFVKYLTSATNTASATGTTGASLANQTSDFVNGESLAADVAISSINAGSNSSTLLTSGATLVGSSAAVQEGVYFVRGQFVRVPEQRIILDKYDNVPSYRVGLTVAETLVTPEADTTLLDNAPVSNNFAAKGAHRLKISLTLTKLERSSTADSNFIELLRIDNGEIKVLNSETQYNLIRDYFAKRTFEESGNYSLDNFGLDKVEVKDDGCGLSRAEIQLMTKKDHYTSKINQFQDLTNGNLTTYGFRGEAVNAICTVAVVKIISKRAEDVAAIIMKCDNKGKITKRN